MTEADYYNIYYGARATFMNYTDFKSCFQMPQRIPELHWSILTFAVRYLDNKLWTTYFSPANDARINALYVQSQLHLEWLLHHGDPHQKKVKLHLQTDWLSDFYPLAGAATDSASMKIRLICIAFEVCQGLGRAKVLENGKMVVFNNGLVFSVESKDHEVFDLTDAIHTLLKQNACYNHKVKLRFDLDANYGVPAGSKVIGAFLTVKRIDEEALLVKLYQSLLSESYGLSTNDIGWLEYPYLPVLRMAGESSSDRLSALQQMLIVENSKQKPTSTTSSTLSSADDIQTGDTVMSFLCPITLTRMSHPAKGVACTHNLQLFDALSFLQLNVNKPIWKCVICKKEIKCHELTLDGKALRLLRTYPGADKCVVKADGGDEAFQGVEAIDLDDEVDDGEDDGKAENGMKEVCDASDRGAEVNALKRRQDPAGDVRLTDNSATSPKRIKLPNGGTMYDEGNVVVVD
ncbi:SUMO ligase siz1 [Chytridiales sp. JEL 0842]|nr:SUMO ligase siz1 [Chytridiales sp. JEL 0842]